MLARAGDGRFWRGVIPGGILWRRRGVLTVRLAAPRPLLSAGAVAYMAARWRVMPSSWFAVYCCSANLSPLISIYFLLAIDPPSPADIHATAWRRSAHAMATFRAFSQYCRRRACLP